MTRTEVHTYAFSVAANVILSLFPFIVLMLTLWQKVFHSRGDGGRGRRYDEQLSAQGSGLCDAQYAALANPQQGTQFFSLRMLLVSSTGVFLPLEVALNSVWGVKKNRTYLDNQVVSIGLAFGVGVLAMASVALTAAQRTLMAWMFFGHTDNWFFGVIANGFLQICALAASIGLFFLIYWGLPNRKVPFRAVLPTAVVMGVLWMAAKYVYIFALPHLDFHSVYGAFYVSVGLMMWAFLSGLLLLAGAHFSATRYTLRLTREAEAKEKPGLNSEP